ncbi:MAG: DUF4397 domain-containing protein [Armatimonadota bacterium]|nr:DUF4397 domain-containing protein [Armatimonadota bacterium]
MRSRWIVGVLSALMLGAAGCDQATNSSGAAPAAEKSAPIADKTATRSPKATTFTENLSATPAFLRGVHLVPETELLAVLSNGAIVVDGVTYGNASPFFQTAPGKLKISAIDATGQAVTGPTSVTVEGSEYVTVVINGTPENMALLPIKHKSEQPMAGRAKVSFMHAAKAFAPVDVLIDGSRHQAAVEYGEATDHKELKPGHHKLQIVTAKTPPTKGGEAPTTSKSLAKVDLTQQLDFAAGKVYSVIIYQAAPRLPKLRLFEDKSGSEVLPAPKVVSPTAPSAAPKAH